MHIYIYMRVFVCFSLGSLGVLLLEYFNMARDPAYCESMLCKRIHDMQCPKVGTLPQRSELVVLNQPSQVLNTM